MTDTSKRFETLITDHVFSADLAIVNRSDRCMSSVTPTMTQEDIT